MPSLFCLLFYDAFSDHAFVFMCVSMYLETDLSTPQETPTQRFSMGLKFETQVQYITRARLAVGELGTSTQSNSSSKIFFIGFFWGISPCGPGPPSPLECNFILPLVTVVLIIPKGVESPSSRRIGVIGALVLILPSETV